MRGSGLLEPLQDTMINAPHRRAGEVKAAGTPAHVLPSVQPGGFQSGGPRISPQSTAHARASQCSRSAGGRRCMGLLPLHRACCAVRQAVWRSQEPQSGPAQGGQERQIRPPALLTGDLSAALQVDAEEIPPLASPQKSSSAFETEALRGVRRSLITAGSPIFQRLDANDQSDSSALDT